VPVSDLSAAAAPTRKEPCSSANTFGVFFPVVFIGSWFLRPSPGAWKVFMLAASAVFYGWWSWRFLALLAGLAVVTHVVAAFVAAARGPAGRIPVAIGSAALLAPVVWFKLDGFLQEPSTDRLTLPGTPDVPLLGVLLPLGLSFFAFQGITYLVELRRSGRRPLPVVDLALHLLFFPRLLAGPIVPAAELVPQLRHRADPRRVEAPEAFRLVLTGLFKKYVISSYLATEIVNPVFAAPADHGALDVLVASYAWAVQLYCDVSGYADIAIGLALLLGVRLPAEFVAPFTATSLTDYWSRWYRTLTGFFRDHVQEPLTARAGVPRAASIAVTMLLFGLWHRGSWTFLVWAGIHAAFLVGERMLADSRARREVTEPPATAAWTVFRWLVTFHVVVLAGVFFRSTSVGGALDVLGRLGSFDGASLLTPLAVATIVTVIALQFVPAGTVEALQRTFGRLPVLAQGVAVGAGLFAVGALAGAPAPFVYFQF
jgi:alginate O-acetyltransferase complex protein AlgI